MVDGGHFLSILVGDLVSVLGVPDTEQRAAQMAGVIEHLPAQKQTGRVHGQNAEQCILSAEADHR